ncbi:conserved hypothetical protein [Ricinus communis]|uniref:Uncharacterized protein n=1 Tax=Ricinus communis TaxID=3988 RepID=B9SE64_RICCO|nr:conserved hypothetical protein [Ricinus communis]
MDGQYGRIKVVEPPLVHVWKVGVGDDWGVGRVLHGECKDEDVSKAHTSPFESIGTDKHKPNTFKARDKT